MKSRVVASSMRLPFRDKDIMRHMSCDFGWNAYGTFCSKKCGISNQPATASTMIRVFPSFEHSAGHVRIPEDNL